MNEQELITGLLKGNETVFKLFVDLYKDRVYNTALGLLQQSNDAEDIAQEVFIQVYRSVHQFKGASSLSTWVYRITVSKCLDFIRSKKRKKRFGIVLNIFSSGNVPLFDPPDFHHPGVLLDNKESAAFLFRLINQLPANQKTAFILNKLEDLSYSEIAAIMQNSESAVDSLLQRAKQNLRKLIIKENNGSTGKG